MADLSNASCVAIGWDEATAQRVYTVVGPYVPGGCYGQVLILSGDLDTIVNASGSGGSQFTADEVAVIKDRIAHPSPFELSSSEGALIAVSVLGVWAVAWGWKQIASMARAGFSNESE